MAVIVEVLGGSLLIAGARIRVVALAIAMFTLATAVFFHTNFADQNQMIHFMKNFAIIGGLLQVAAYGGGRFSLDSVLDRRSSASVNAALAPSN